MIAGESDALGGSPSDSTSTGVNAAGDLPVGTVLAERFCIVRLLGIGGMGVVYVATDLSLDVQVAVKLLRNEVATRSDAFERFRQELLLSRQVSSPHVVRIHDIAQHRGRWLISMDLIDGQPLDKVLDARAPLPVDEALGIARQIALGLSAAHARQVIHRDLKPSNILIDAQGTAYIADFGIARSLGTSGLTRTGAVVGTPDYLSPEQARAEPVDGRSDLYALGLLLYEMLVGQPPFSGGTQSESLAQRLIGPPPPIRKLRPDTPVWVERLLDRLLRSNPAHRLQSADAVVQAIDRREVPRDFRPSRRSVLAAVAFATLAAAGVFAWRQALVPSPSLPPPERMLVLPVENNSGDATLDAALAGYAEQLRQSLAVGTDVIIVDGERVEQAVAQLEMPDSRIREINSQALLRILPATQVLRPRLLRSTGGYRFSATLSNAGGSDRALISDANPDLISAGRGFVRATALALRPAEDFRVDLLPNRRQTLGNYGVGLQERRRGRPELALEAFSKASANEPGFVAAWLAQAQAANLAGKSEDAATAAARGLRLKPPAPLQAALAQAQALAVGDVAAVIAAQQLRVRAQPDDLDALLRLAMLQGQGGDQVSAIANLRRLLARDANDPRAWFALGKSSIKHGEIRPAVDEFLVRALVLYKRGRNPLGEADTVNALGIAYSRLGQTDDAQEQYRKAVELRRALGDRRGVASSLRNLAQLSTIKGRFDDAQAQLVEARSLFEALGDESGLSAVDNEIGLLAEERGDFIAAEAAFRRVLRSREQSGDSDGAAESLNNIGFAQYQLGDYDSAQVFWQQALTAFTKLDNRSGEVRAQQNLGSLEIARGRWTEARRLLSASLASAERKQMVEESSVSRYYLAELELLEGRPGQALDQLERARIMFAKREDQRGLIDAGLLRARILLAARAGADSAKALATLEPLLADASDEQRALAELLRADIALRNNDAVASRKFAAQALASASASGIQALKLRAAMLGDSAAVLALDGQIARLGNLPLRLDWLARAMATRLASGTAPAAIDTYGEAKASLRGHEDALAAFDLHRLGAQALAAGGQAAAAKTARQQAGDALTRARAELPPALRAAFDADPQVRS
ncbi:MAG: protein kinase, partial [Arenimonas sp.]